MYWNVRLGAFPHQRGTCMGGLPNPSPRLGSCSLGGCAAFWYLARAVLPGNRGWSHSRFSGDHLGFCGNGYQAEAREQVTAGPSLPPTDRGTEGKIWEAKGDVCSRQSQPVLEAKSHGSPIHPPCVPADPFFRPLSSNKETGHLVGSGPGAF